jgi:crotonobetainyl-CoA:carnitine CoA-transferase CaiB-like acyl-CoA transferase
MAGRAPGHLLDGYKVLNFTHFIAGPTATGRMAALGVARR